MRKLLLVACVVAFAACGGQAAPTREDTRLANPASVFCEERGGTVEIREDRGGNQYGVCVFDNGAECEEWAFYRGECEPEAGR
jgi:putative hemolysin